MISSKMRGVLCLACLTVGLSAQTATPSGGYGLHEGADNVSAAEPGGDPIDLVIDPATDSTPTPGTTHYVSLAGANRSPYTNWTDAATSIAAALQVAIGDGDTVLVAAGTYALPSQLVLEHGVVLRSVDGAASTVVDAEQNSRCFLIQHADAVIDGFTITGGKINSDNGGGVYFDGGGLVQNSIIRGNTSVGWDGGGVYGYDGFTIRNCLITGNTAKRYGGGIAQLSFWESGYIENCTVVGNTSGNHGGGIYVTDIDGVRNCIVVQNTAPYDQNVTLKATPCSYSCLTPTPPGEGNITADPQFVNAAGGDYRLADGSPCRDIGLNLSWMTNAVDVAGNARLANLYVDMGAFENTSPPPATVELRVNSLYGSPHPPVGISGLAWGSNVTCRVGATPLVAGTTQYVCMGWSGTRDVPASGSSTNVTFSPARPSALTWIWGTNYYLNIGPVAHGRVAASGVWHPEDTPASLAPVPDAGYAFQGWNGDIPADDIYDNPLALVMDRPRAVAALFVPADTTYHVSPDGAHRWPYTNWTDAATNILDAVATAIDGATVWVTNGLYVVPSPITLDRGITVASVNGDASTIISGNDSHRCFSLSHSNALVRGFTLTDGLASQGGAVSLSSGVVQDCLLKGNRAWYKGGGAYLSGSGTLRSCVVISNRVFDGFHGNVWGGGIYMRAGGVVENCTVVDNEANAGQNGDAGGGIYCYSSGMSVRNSIFYQNTAKWGADLHSGPATSLPAGTVRNCWIGKDPLFVDRDAGDYHLQSASPCIDTGLHEAWMSEGADFGGSARIQGQAVDMGVYEYVPVPRQLVIDGSPARYGTAGPTGYGVHSVMELTSVTNQILNPAVETGGVYYVCSGWIGSGSVPTSGVTNVVAFTLRADSTLTWQWAVGHWLSLQASHGSVTGASAGWHPEGRVHELTPWPAAGYALDHWLVNGTNSGSATPLYLTMSEPLDVEAVFERLAPIDIEWEGVPYTNNVDDSTGFGAVPYDYLMGRYEVTCGEYANFLNSVARTDTYGLYSSYGHVRSGSTGRFTYQPKTGWADKPVSRVNFYDALRFANWLHNGQPAGEQDASTTEDGAYTFSGSTTVSNRNAVWTHALASEDEWYKAAYFSPSTDGYFAYATRSDTLPIRTAPPGGPNAANYEWAMGSSLTEVGAYLNSPGPFGTYDQNGNVAEWTEGNRGSSKSVRGGSAFIQVGGSGALLHSAKTYAISPQTETSAASSGIGFRVVREATNGLHNLTLVATNGTIQGGHKGWKPTGATFDLYPEREGRFVFDHWSLNGENRGRVIPLTITMTHSLVVEAVFAVARDFGDLPPSYGMTTLGDDGARHEMLTMWLGKTIDGEPDGWESADAGTTAGTGDDGIATEDHDEGIARDDEDGIVALWSWKEGADGASIRTEVLGRNPGFLSGWVDWNNDSDFSDVGEHVLNMAAVDPGAQVVSFDVPHGGLDARHGSNRFARFRLAPEALPAMTPRGLVMDGEVEDYYMPPGGPSVFWLRVISPVGNPFPRAGIQPYIPGTVLTNSVITPDVRGTTRYLNEGWRMTGGNPASGPDPMLTMVVTNDAALEWLWSTQHWVSVTSGEGGTTAPIDEWREDGRVLEVTAEPDLFYRFAAWSGVPDGLSSNNPLRFELDQGREIQAHFTNLYPRSEWFLYVDGTNAAPTPPYTNWQTAATSIQDAIDIVDSTDSNAIIIVRAGHYVLSSQIQLDKAIRLRSESGPETTIVDGDDRVRCLYVNNENAVVEGFTMTRGYFANSSYPSYIGGGGVYIARGRVSGCHIVSNRGGRVAGAGVGLRGTAELSHCVISNNVSATGDGGGVFLNKGGIVRNCLIAGNSAVSSSDGGGVYGYYGGTVENCTISDNACTRRGGGVMLFGNSVVRNCIIYDNRAASGPNHNRYNGGTYTYCCTTPAPTGEGHITNAPSFVNADTGNYRLDTGSPCIGAGMDQPWMHAATDLDGYHRIINLHVDIGAYEDTLLDPDAYLLVSSPHGATGPSVGTNRFARHANVICWVDGSTMTRGGTQYVHTGWLGAGNVPPSGTGTNVAFDLTRRSVLAWTWETNHYLSAMAKANGTIDVGDGWQPRGTVLQITATADDGYMFEGWSGDVPLDQKYVNPLDLTMDRERSFVATFLPLGPSTHYASLTGSHQWPYANWTEAATNIQDAVNAAKDAGDTVMVGTGTYALASQIIVDQAITVQSAGAASNTVIDAQGNSRCLYLKDQDAVIDGMTITGGKTSTGGGVYAIGRFTLRNCLITGNTVTGEGGGVYGKYSETGRTIENCVIVNNQAGDAGGGVTLYKSGTIRNSVVSGNTAAYGGGIFCKYGGRIDACTIVSNNAAATGGGVSLPDAHGMRNSIVVHNNAGSLHDNVALSSTGPCVHNCSLPLISGVGNMTNDPQFVDYAGGDFRISGMSPCVDAGTNIAWMAGERDLDENARIYHLTVDMGAYENRDGSAAFVITGSPERRGLPSPADYGTYDRAPMTVITNSVTSPVDETNGLRFACQGWAGTGSAPAAGTGTTATFTIQDDTVLTWLWGAEHLLEAGVSGSGRVDVADAWYATGAVVQVTAMPAEGHRFLYWTGDVPQTVTASNPVHLVMDQARNVSAITTLIVPWPSRGVTLMHRRPDFRWDDVANATWYHVWIGRNGVKYHDVWLSQTSAWQPDFGMHGGDYTWWVQPWSPDTGHGAWSGPSVFSISNRVPTETMLLAPDGRLATSPTQFIWRATEHATHYQWWLSRDGEKYDTGWVADHPTFTPSVALPYGIYDWWVRAWSPDGYGPWSQRTRFVYGMPETVTPSGLIYDTRRPEFAWRSVVDASWYEISVTRNGVASRDLWVQTATHFTFASSFLYGDYSWKVRAWAPNSLGPWSEVTAFSIGKPVSLLASGKGVGWDGASSLDATWYRIWIGDDTGQKIRDAWVTLAQSSTGGTARHWNFGRYLPDGSYHVWLQAWSKNQGFSPWSQASSFSVAWPKITALGMNQAQAGQAEITWSARAGEHYDLWWSTNLPQGFEILQSNILCTGSNVVTITGHLPARCYFRLDEAP